MTNTIPGSARPPSRAIGFREHLEFFDEDRDQAISLGETRRALERLGFGRLINIPAAAAINLGVTGLGLLEGLPIHPAKLDLGRTSLTRHPDTRFVDEDGNFDDARLDDAFARYGRTFDGDAVTMAELASMLAGRVVADARGSAVELVLLPIGIPAIIAEWAALFWVAGSNRCGVRVLEKEAVRRFYTDPRFFQDVARLIAKEKAARHGSTLGRVRNLVQEWLL